MSNDLKNNTLGVKAVSVSFDLAGSIRADNLYEKIQNTNEQIKALLISKESHIKQLANLVANRLKEQHEFVPGSYVTDTQYGFLFVVAADGKLYYINVEDINENS